MTPKEKAEKLVDKYKEYVHGYVGSSMLTNTEYPEQILKQAKKCALIAVDELIKSHHAQLVDKSLTHPAEEYWQEVKQELETFKAE